MPAGYSTTTNSSTKIVMSKTHKNGDRTRIVAEQIPNSDRWFVHVEDGGRTTEVARTPTKRDAKREMELWAQNNPKGLQQQAGLFTGGMGGFSF